MNEKETMKAIAKIKVSFPCNYEFEMNYTFNQFISASIGNGDNPVMPLCPLHGKSCPNKKVVKVKKRSKK